MKTNTTNEAVNRSMLRQPLVWRQAHNRLIPGDASGRLGLGVLTAALFGALSLQFGATFFSTGNVLAILISMSSVAIAAAGTMPLIISGNIDLSIGSMYALVAIFVGEVAVHTNSTVLAIATGLVSGAALGAINGGLVRVLKLSPLIVTIAMLAIYGGLAYAITGGVALSGFPASFVKIGEGGIGSVQYPILISTAIFIVGAFLLVRTRAGLRIYAIGGNALSAERAGIRVGRTVVGLYALNGLMIGVVATLAAARLDTADPSLGTNFEFDVITAVILGGVAFAGGAGRPLGVYVGIAMIGIIDAGVIFEGMQSYWQQVVQGSLLLIALGSDQAVQHLRERRTSTRREGRRGWLLRAREPVEPIANLNGRSDPSLNEGLTAQLPALAVTKREQRPTEHPAARAPVLEARNVGKQYGAVVAMSNVSLALNAGEVLCVIGDNGAGKSTLIQMLSGATRPDAGSIWVDGQPVVLHSPGGARAAGIETVYQDLALCGNLSVSHNLTLGTEPTRRLARILPVRDDRRARSIAVDRLASLGIVLKDYDVTVQRLSGGQRQSVAIARAMEPGVKVVILDEPTAALGVTQTEHVLQQVRAMADSGTAVLLVTHDIEVVMAAADRVAVLRLGSVVHSGPIDAEDEMTLLQHMAGVKSPGGHARGGRATPSAERV
jgi:ribose/xylose/arabinose/galactoside ABC-type transport system permease subunit/ABC-type branched-subunit amino acid transport system ATPase component